ncbi:ESPR domain-containing protein [Burkholderia gladioli]|nr:ESPR domain-containing protein [Burkholderia gladioli]
MNKNSHRSVFNRVHCMFVAVEETAHAPSVIQTPNSRRRSISTSWAAAGFRLTPIPGSTSRNPA